jgi:exonuclease SbcC
MYPSLLLRLSLAHSPARRGIAIYILRTLARSFVRITRVELDNIKSYRHAVILLREGTTAIRGQNGAGKSTLVEAIGFALFDAMNYNQSQFVRDGEKSGQVAVSFISALDEREYQVVRRCGSSPAWYVYDPEIGSRVVEQRADVITFLRQHLRIEGDVELSALFSDAIGVPQGTFTSDFLLTPAQRKKKFDTLLQVEDYRKAADKLNETRVYLQEQKREQELRIAELERETAQLAGWRDRLAEHHAQTVALATRLEVIQREAAEVEGRREELRTAEAEVARCAGAAEVARTALAAALAEEDGAAARHGEALTAHDTCTASQAGHRAFLAAERTMAAARAREHVRADLLARRGDATQRLEGSKRDHVHAQARLQEAATAAQRVVELQPGVERQHDLEVRLQEARLRAERLEGTRQRLEHLQHERSQIEHEQTELLRRIAELEALQPEAAQLIVYRGQLEAMQAAIAAHAQQERRLRTIAGERDDVQTQQAQVAADEARMRENAAKLRAQQSVVEELPTREAEHRAADEEMRRLEAQQEHARLSREQSGQGQCPFLREPCLNIRRRGENSLASFFDRQIQELEAALVPARARRDAAEGALQHAQKVRIYFDRLSEYEDRLASDKRQRAQLDQRLTRLADEEAELSRALKAAPDARTLAAKREATHRAEVADRELATLPALQQQQRALSERLTHAAADLAGLEQRVTDLSAAPDTVRRLDAALSALGDPRAESKAAAEVARERPRLEAELAAAEATMGALETEVARLDADLQPYVGLDEELRALEAELVRTRGDHTRYLQSEQLAARLEQFAAVHGETRRKREAATTAHEAAQTRYTEAQAHFDRGALEALNEQASALGAERGQKTAELQHTQRAAADLERDITRVERLEREELAAARAEWQTLDDLEKMLQHFRETIKEAGPYIMRALLRQISVEANRIFGEILGDRSAQLSWEQDYEIVLRRDGRERTFALLSGGEQMSAALAVRLALLRSLTRLDIAFFDEPTQNMDGQRRGNLAEQIRRIRGFEQLLIISHDDTFEQGLDSVIYLERRDGETVLIDAEAMAVAV